MNIKLVSYTPFPERAIAAAMMNMGIGKGVADLSTITDTEARDVVNDMFKSHLDAPGEYATFNFLWEGIPVWMRAQLVRHRVGWGYAERSLRFYDANLGGPVERHDWESMPSVKEEMVGKHTPQLSGQSLRGIIVGEMKRQMVLYELLLKEGVDAQDARNVIGVWFPTDLQTTCTYRALRSMLAARLSSQAHPFWQTAARQIKALVTKVSPVLGDGLIDICQLSGRCVWQSRLDRNCPDCVARKWREEHVCVFDRDTTLGKATQCSCGKLRPLELTNGQNAS